MTTYTDIPNSLVAVGAKPFASTIQALRDNPLALNEGDASVPNSLRIRGAAMRSTSAGTVVLRDCLPWGTQTVSNTTTTAQSQRVEASAFTALVACTVQVLISGTFGSGGGSSCAILKNGTAVQTYTTNQTGATVNVSLAAGDTLAVLLSATGTSGGSTGTATLTACQYRVDVRSAVMT